MYMNNTKVKLLHLWCLGIVSVVLVWFGLRQSFAGLYYRRSGAIVQIRKAYGGCRREVRQYDDRGFASCPIIGLAISAIYLLSLFHVSGALNAPRCALQAPLAEGGGPPSPFERAVFLTVILFGNWEDFHYQQSIFGFTVATYTILLIVGLSVRAALLFCSTQPPRSSQERHLLCVDVCPSAGYRCQGSVSLSLSP